MWSNQRTQPLYVSYIETDRQWCWSYYDYINIIKYGQSGFDWLNMNNCRVINKYYIWGKEHIIVDRCFWGCYVGNQFALHAFKLKINLQIYNYKIIMLWWRYVWPIILNTKRKRCDSGPLFNWWYIVTVSFVSLAY